MHGNKLTRSRLNELKVPKVQIIPNNSTHVEKINFEKRTRRIFFPTGIFNKINRKLCGEIKRTLLLCQLQHELFVAKCTHPGTDYNVI